MFGFLMVGALNFLGGGGFVLSSIRRCDDDVGKLEVHVRYVAFSIMRLFYLV